MTSTIAAITVDSTDALAAATFWSAVLDRPLDPDRPALLLTPGTGALEDVASPVRVALDVLRSTAPEWQVAVTSPALARHGIGSHGEDVHLLTDTYPLARSLAAFDGAVSAAGYNSVHELLGARIPTVLVPGQSLGTDDQPGRADDKVDDLEVCGLWLAWFAMVQGERPEHRALRGADGDRPAGSQSVPERQLADLRPHAEDPQHRHAHQGGRGRAADVVQHRHTVGVGRQVRQIEHEVPPVLLQQAGGVIGEPDLSLRPQREGLLVDLHPPASTEFTAEVLGEVVRDRHRDPRRHVSDDRRCLPTAGLHRVQRARR